MNKKNIFFYGIAFVFVIAATGIVAADTVTVDGSNESAYATIQAAVDSASEGDTIIVYPGEYVENVDVGKKLAIISKSGKPEETVVRAADHEDHVFHIAADSVEIRGFTATGGLRNTTMYKSGIYLERANHCIIRDNIVSGNGNGIYLKYPASFNTLINNTADSNEYNGFILSVSGGNRLEGNRASNCRTGFYIENFGNNTLESGEASKNERGIVLQNSDGNILKNNTITLNEDRGVTISCSSDNRLYDNTISHNTETYGFGIAISGSSSGNLLQANTIRDNNYNIYIVEPARDNILKDNIVSENLFELEEIIEANTDAGEGALSIEDLNTDRKPLTFSPETFEALKNETYVLATYGKMPSFGSEEERRNWLAKLQEISEATQYEIVEQYFSPNGSVILYGIDCGGYLEIGIENGTEVKSPLLDEIYEILDREGRKLGVEDVPVTFTSVELVFDEEKEEIIAEETQEEKKEIDEGAGKGEEEEDAVEGEAAKGDKTEGQNAPGFRIMSSLLGFLVSIGYFKRRHL